MDRTWRSGRLAKARVFRLDRIEETDDEVVVYLGDELGRHGPAAVIGEGQPLPAARRYPSPKSRMRSSVLALDGFRQAAPEQISTRRRGVTTGSHTFGVSGANFGKSRRRSPSTLGGRGLGGHTPERETRSVAHSCRASVPVTLAAAVATVHRPPTTKLRRAPARCRLRTAALLVHLAACGDASRGRRVTLGRQQPAGADTTVVRPGRGDSESLTRSRFLAHVNTSSRGE